MSGSFGLSDLFSGVSGWFLSPSDKLARDADRAWKYDEVRDLGEEMGVITGLENGSLDPASLTDFGKSALKTVEAAEGVPDTGLGLDDLGLSGKDMLGIGMAGIGALQNRQNYKLQKKAIEDQIETARMNRSLAADQAINQMGVRAGLTSAFGGDSSGLAAEMNRYKRYQV